MANDNTRVINPNVAPGGNVIRTEDIQGVQFQAVKLVLGAVNIDDGDVSSSNPMPVSLASTPLPPGAATEATLSAINTKTPALGAAAKAASVPVNIASDQTVPVELFGTDDSGQMRAFHADTDGHLEVAIHGPRTPFGALHTERLHPIFQADAVYGINAQLALANTSGSGVATAESGLFKVATGTTIYSFGVVQSRKRLRYRPGQGSSARFTTVFPASAAQSILVAGVGHSEDGYFIGYNGTSFGILHSYRGRREIRTLTITTGSSTAENVTVRLNGTNYSVAVTTGGNVYKTAYEISLGTYAGWTAEAVGATVVFIRSSAGLADTGTYTLTATTAVGAFAQTRAGVAATDVWVAQSSWNGDKMDGTGPSGVTLDPTKGNIWRIDMQYLGFGTVQFLCEIAPSDNNPTFVVCHTIRWPNSNALTNVRNPSFPFTLAAYSAGSTTNLNVYSGSFAGFIEGDKVMNGPRITYNNTITTAGAVNYQALFTVRNTRYYNGEVNQSVINLISFAAALEHTQPGSIFLIRNGTLGGNPNFVSAGPTSCAMVDTAATTVTPASTSDLLISIPLPKIGSVQLPVLDELTLQPGEWVTLAAKMSSGTASHCSGSLNTREDQ